MKRITIAIDGYSSCGKSTIARALAAKLGYSYVDSGAMYRAITLYCLQHGIIKDGAFIEDEIVRALDDVHLTFQFNPASRSSDTFLNGENVEKQIRTMEVSSLVSPVSKIKAVRQRMVALQRLMGADKGVVMDGRDIGTNVFPDAELKLFMTADVDVRVQRRVDELRAKGQPVSLDEVRQNLINRDYEDSHRKENPLLQASDAVVLDNSELSRDQQLDFVLNLIADLKIEA
ncbi:MAG: (d)CMP kinase [Bacteroidota bacterium]|jgi:cytidylate kinase